MEDPCEVVRHGVAVGDAPPSPPSFGIEYKPPPHRTKLLETKNPHERDARIVFYELPHVYTVDGRALDTSVTTVAHKHCEKFNESKGISLMKGSRKQAWPRLQYATGVRALTEGEMLENGEGILIVSGDITTNAIYGEEDLWEKAHACKEKIGTAVKFYAFQRAMTDDEILAEWETTRVDGSNRGTEAHLMMELWMNSEPCRLSDPEVQTGLGFVRNQLAPLGITAYRTEWEIFADDEALAGSIDCVGTLPNGEIVIVDWKRCKHLDNDVVSNFGKHMSAPLGHLHDCSGAKYTLQLSIYAWILEKYYNLKVGGLVLCSLHPAHPFHTWMPYLKAEAEFLMYKRREHISMQQRADIEADASYPRCAASGQLLFDAVRFDGKMYNRPNLMVLHEDAQVEADSIESKRVETLMSRMYKSMSSYEIALAHEPRWEQRITKAGHQNFLPIRRNDSDKKNEGSIKG